MESLETKTAPTLTTGLRSATAVCRDRGISDTTLWRMSKRGWVRLVNISGRVYVDLASLAEFDRRATNGEFAKPPAGAARKSAEIRVARESSHAQ